MGLDNNVTSGTRLLAVFCFTCSSFFSDEVLCHKLSRECSCVFVQGKLCGDNLVWSLGRRNKSENNGGVRYHINNVFLSKSAKFCVQGVALK